MRQEGHISYKTSSGPTSRLYYACEQFFEGRTIVTDSKSTTYACCYGTGPHILQAATLSSNLRCHKIRACDPMVSYPSFGKVLRYEQEDYMCTATQSEFSCSTTRFTTSPRAQILVDATHTQTSCSRILEVLRSSVTRLSTNVEAKSKCLTQMGYRHDRGRTPVISVAALTSSFLPHIPTHS